MTIEFKKLAGIGAALAALTAAPAMAQDMSDMSASDGDADGTISQDEFNSAWTDRGVFGDWDSDGDGNITEDEFNSGVFSGYDDDDSGAIEEPEFGDVGDDVGDGGFWDV